MENTRGNMELLAPAGGPEQLHYAIRFGADAVYLAADRFGMRARAANFPLEGLAAAVAQAHAANVKVHLTCNVLMHQHQLAELPAFLEAAAAAGIDALIIGDLGVVPLAQRYAPGVEIHASTQASVCNSEAAKVWQQLGATRIVAAREMSLSDLAAMREAMPDGLELEVFAHGAMCMAYSGRCLVSDYMTHGQRSGVHGNCAQTCRWELGVKEVDGVPIASPVNPKAWQLGVTEPRRQETFGVEQDKHGSYLLNAEDLCMLEHLDDLHNIGVDSIKIEGRNKKAYYVACMVNAYRQVLDGANPADFLREMECVSHRPYSTGFYYGMAHQTTDDLIYTHTSSWAAQVLSCEPAGSGMWRIEFRCRTKFSPSSPLEILSPGKPIVPVHMWDLWHIMDSRFDVPDPRLPEDFELIHADDVPVSEANHPSQRYFAFVDAPVEPDDIIRVLH